jgi:signal transduction histidine kinase
MTIDNGLNVVLRIPPEWARIDPVRQAVGLCVVAVFASDDLKDALGMVCAELLENAIKYGKPDGRGVKIQLIERGDGPDKEVMLSVTNAIESTSHHIDSLRQRLAWIDAFSTASDAYMAALSQVYERADEGAESGLGLVRIAYEGGCKIDCESPGEGLMTVRAHYSLSHQGAVP